MNKFLTISVVVLAIIALVYVVKQDNIPEIKAHKDAPASVTSPESKSDISIVQTAEKTPAASSSQPQSSASSELPTAAMVAEQTQNAVDFNAPGAGTAQQKAGAAAAATKAYQESKQQGH